MADIIQKYCETLDEKYIKILSQEHKVIFRTFAKVVKNHKKGNMKMAEKVLKATERKIPESTRSKSEEELQRMSVGSTGARQGDTLFGIQKGNSGAIIKITQDVFPSQKILDRLRYFPDIWQEFLKKLDSFPFFTKMPIKGREIWFEIFENHNDFFEMDMPLHLLQPGTGNYDKKTGSIFIAYLSENILDDMMSRELTSQEINDTLIEYTGKSSTLVILKTFWRLFIPYNIETEFNGLVIDVFTGNIIKTDRNVFIIKLPTKYQKEKNNYVITHKQKVGFYVDEKSNKIEDKYEEDKTIVNTIEKMTTNFSAAALKSLLQKIIRFTPKNVSFGKKLIPGEKVLEWAIRKLVIHPGVFVPNIQRFVTGKESAPKRIAVSIYEDSHLEKDDFSELLILLSGALIAQRIKEWKPSESFVKKWVKIAKKAYKNQKGIISNFGKYTSTEPFALQKNEKNVAIISSVILDELRSFPTDLGLARAWAKDDYKVKKVNERPEIMPFYHCVDQHWLPEIVYFYSTNVIYETKILTQSHPFQDLFNKLFHEVTGINPRKDGYDQNFEENEFVKETRKAQKLVLLSLQITKKDRNDTENFFTMKYQVDDAWLAGLVGAMKIIVKGAKTLVTLKVDNPFEYIVAREPISKRSKKQYEPLSPEQEQESIQKATELLKKGIRLNQCKSPVQILESATLFLKNEQDDEEKTDEQYYMIQLSNGKKIRWNNVKKVSLKFPVHQVIEKTLRNAIKYQGKGVEENFQEKIEEIILNSSPKIIQRILMYFSGVTSRIIMPKISRDGGGTGIVPVLHDVETFQTLCKLSIVIPGAFCLDKTTEFVVNSIPLLQKVVEIIKNVKKQNEKYEKWIPKIIDKSRKPYSYQLGALQDMVENYQRANKGNFLWLPLGSGKTYLVLCYLRWHRQNNTLPKYILYTLPPESLASIIKEIEYFKLNINLIIPLKSISKKLKEYEKHGIKISSKIVLDPFCINIIFHDHIRLCINELEIFIEDSMLIIDEVHLFLNQTIRTTMGITLAKLSKIFVCLTGTPIVDNKTEKLIGWFEQIVPFEVNNRNFWAAANNMISKEITTGIRTEDENILAKFSEKETKEYKKLVPILMGGTNDNPRSTDWLRAADMCYEACDRKIVNLCKKYINDRGIMVVVRNKNHQQKILQMLIKEGIKNKDIFLIEKDKSIILTDETVENGEKDYKIVIVTKNRSQGYTLTRLSMMVTSVYPSNTATREQLRGRINRIGQKTEPLLYKTVHIGLLTYIMENHTHAGNILQTLQSLSKKS